MAVALSTFQTQSQERVCQLQSSRYSNRAFALPVRVECLTFRVNLKIRPRGLVTSLQGDHFVTPLLEAASLAAGRGQDPCCKFIVGSVFFEPCPYPGLKPRRGLFFLQTVGVNTKVSRSQQVAELQRPQRRVSRFIQQLIDLL